MGRGTKYHCNMNVLYGYYVVTRNSFGITYRGRLLWCWCVQSLWNLPWHLLHGCPMCLWLHADHFLYQILKSISFESPPILSVALPQKWHKRFLQFQNSVSKSKVYFHSASLVCLPGHLKMILMGKLIQKWSHCPCHCYCHRTSEHFINGK